MNAEERRLQRQDAGEPARVRARAPDAAIATLRAPALCRDTRPGTPALRAFTSGSLAVWFELGNSVHDAVAERFVSSVGAVLRQEFLKPKRPPE